MFFDYHVHSDFSSDSSMKMDECIECAIKMGISELCFTDHLDIDYPGENIFELDYKKYQNSLDDIKKRYGNRIKIKTGIEIGLQIHIVDKINTFLHNKEFDFIIGSIHAVNEKELHSGDFYKNKSKFQAYSEYFEYLHECIKKFNNFDVLGHMDIVKRYGDYKDIGLLYSDYREIIDSILKELISTNRGIEINTSGIRYSLGSPHPTIDILKAYKRLGGEIITVGSDSHKTSHLAAHFHNTYEMLRECDFKYITSYNKRKPIQVII